jgi:hypothetical protein
MLDQVHRHPTSTVYVAIELSKKSWVVAIMHPTKGRPSIHRIKGGAFSDLMVKLRAAAVTANVCSFAMRQVTMAFGWRDRSMPRASSVGFSIRPVFRSIAGRVASRPTASMC